jgi:hypothetical protein
LSQDFFCLHNQTKHYFLSPLIAPNAALVIANFFLVNQNLKKKFLLIKNGPDKLFFSEHFETHLQPFIAQACR